MEIGRSAPQLAVHGSAVDGPVAGMGIHMDPAGHMACGSNVIMAGSGTTAAHVAVIAVVAGAVGAVYMAARRGAVGRACVGAATGPAGAVGHVTTAGYVTAAGNVAAVVTDVAHIMAAAGRTC